MEIKNIFLVHIIFVNVSLIFAIPVALRSPFRDRGIVRPWRELRFHSEEDYGRDESVSSSSDINAITLSRKAIKYPDDNQGDSEVLVAERNSIPEAIRDPNTSEGSQPRLERFYRHRSPVRSREPEIIVFPSEDDDEPMSSQKNVEYKTDRDSRDELRFDQRSESTLSDNVTADKFLKVPSFPKTADEMRPDMEVSGDNVHQVIPTAKVTEIPEIDNNTTQQPSGNEELDVREQSLYTGPTLKTTDDSGCPEGFKKTRNGSCQKPSRRLMQMG